MLSPSIPSSGRRRSSSNGIDLDFWLGVPVDADRGLLQATTCVTLRGWRGRLYFLPVRWLRPVVFRSMIAAAIRRNGGHYTLQPRSVAQATKIGWCGMVKVALLFR
ncbi:MAG: hypothetical protein ACR2P2_00165 [Nakamurella sp.]